MSQGQNDRACGSVLVEVASQKGSPRCNRDILPDFRHQLWWSLVRAGRNPNEWAQGFELSEQTIRNWVQQANLDRNEPPEVGSGGVAELHSQILALGTF